MLTIQISEPRLAAVAFCVALAGLLAVLVLGCDRDGRFRAR